MTNTINNKVNAILATLDKNADVLITTESGITTIETYKNGEFTLIAEIEE